ncbi:MAG: glucose-6-phosphate isomerase, partial [Betaproteobacteria bacterium]|nr:glucose-6-phosphate isomerase [Betaproteobacteria bacterium]
GVTRVRLPDASPRSLGTYLATLEHRIHAEAVLADVNAFDQFGVELHKSRGDLAVLKAR